jgi:hypothetical protein
VWTYCTENDLARMGLDSCTLLNASSLRLDEKVILFPTQIPRHGFIIQIWISSMNHACDSTAKT